MIVQQHIETSTKYLKNNNDWLENAAKVPKKSVGFVQDDKPYQRKLPNIKSEKKLWTWYLRNPFWAESVHYYISENYHELENNSRTHILKSLRTKWITLSDEEKKPYQTKALSAITRDKDGIGYMKGDEDSLEKKEKFVIEVIQPAINTFEKY